ncbi:MAG: hypothetical protein HFE30_01555 [Clostridiales bacterium]|nr:hypothetical protein [Clostridiales bacterium]
MNEYTQEQETEIVRDAMTLTTAIKIGEEELQKQRGEKFRPKPPAPIREILEIPKIKAQIPLPPKAKYSYSDFLKDLLKNKFVLIPTVVAILICFIWELKLFSFVDGAGIIMFIISVVCFAPFVLIGTYFLYKLKVDTLNQRLARSPEYLKAVENAKQVAKEKQQKVNEEIPKKQAEIDARYEADLEHYNTVTVPTYNKERDTWNEKQAKKINALEEELSLNKEILESLYDTTRKISITYRELWILRWLYDDMSSSDHDIRYATDLLDKNRQRLATEQSGRMVKDAVNEMHASMIAGFNDVYEAIEEGNEELAKIRRDQNIANAINIAQRHNLNKTVKGINKSTLTQQEMMNKYFNKKK